MRAIANVPANPHHLEPLESRRLLSLTPVGDETVMPPLGHASDFDIAAADDGSYIVASATGDLTVHRFSPGGQSLGAPLTVASGGVSDLAASVDPDGDAVVAWMEFEGNDMFSFHFRLISKDGVMGEPVMVGETIDQNIEFRFSPAVSMDDSGGFFLAWLYHAPGVWHETAQVRAFDAAGEPRAAQFEVRVGDTLNALGTLDLAAEPDGSGAVLAVDQSNESGFDFVTFNRVSTTAPVGPLGLIADTPTSSDEGSPSVVVYPDGTFAIAYTRFAVLDRNDDSSIRTDQESFVQRFDADGQPVGAEVGLGASLGGDAVETAAIDALPGGGFVAAYVHTSGETNTLYVERFDADGTPFGDDIGPVAIDSGPRLEWLPGGSPPQTLHFAQFARPAIAADADGRVVVVAYAEHVGVPDDTTVRPEPGPVRVRTLANDFAEIRDSILQVLGTDADESIRITGDTTTIVVNLNGVTKTFDADDVSGIVTSGFGGDDTIINDTALPSTLLGGTGNDKILGGSGGDSISGGDGKDKLLGREGKDSLSGNAGNDTLEGGLQADRVAGNGGRDRLYGNGGNDRLYGGAQGDWLHGQHGSDQLFGQGGNDRLYDDNIGAAAGVDTLTGGAGDDLFGAQDSLADELFGGRGSDQAVTADEDDLLASIEIRPLSPGSFP